MHNLFRLSSRSSLEGYFYKPRADRELLSEYATGLIGTTGCPSGEVQTWLRIGDYEKARQAAADFQDILGRDNYFLELMDHGLSIENRVRDGLLRLSKDLGIPPVATNDSHYVRQEDAGSHEHLLCVSSGSTMADPKRFRFDGDGYYIKSPAEMRALWADRYDLRAACDNTLLIAERCDVEFNENANYMPRFPVPEGENEDSWFVKEVEKGLRYRYPDGIPDDVRKQADFEVGVITSMGFPGYFLVVADFINWAKDHGIRVGPGPWLRCGLDVRLRDAHHRPRPAPARPDLRAVPQPRPRLDARLRHRLRRASARRGDPLRLRQVRRRPGLDDRHLRHHQGQAGGQGLLPHPGLPLRHRRQDHQGDAGAGDGQGRPAQAAVQPRARRATARAASSAPSTTTTAT